MISAGAGLRDSRPVGLYGYMSWHRFGSAGHGPEPNWGEMHKWLRISWLSLCWAGFRCDVSAANLLPVAKEPDFESCHAETEICCRNVPDVSRNVTQHPASVPSGSVGANLCIAGFASCWNNHSDFRTAAPEHAGMSTSSRCG